MKNLNFSWLRYFVCGLLVAGLFTAVSPAYASEEKGGNELGFNPTEMILHHVLDDYSWHIADWKDETGHEHVVSIPLPVILFTDGNLDVFMSSAFHHGEHTVVKGDREYKLDHGHIEEVNGKKVWDFSFTKNVTSMFLSVVLLFVIFFAVLKGYRNRKGQSPKGIQSFFEPIIIFIRDEVAKPTLGNRSEKFLPYLLCVFFFIWFNNVLGLFPAAANLSGNIAFTMTLAVFTLIVTNVNGNKHYWQHIFATPGVPKPLLIIMAPVEIMGIFTKPIALMLRLFANITAGHISILSFITLTFILKSALIGFAAGLLIVPLYFLELFVALLQAYIFTILTGLYIGMATEEHGDHH
ncbi:F0F1 ATP synthase subunit A [Limibacter armeniacum]|uniref:F0F1 ATP synthase subunit A n=1 Tax=Limibacter armeniacum TaxID=466084 RepID=UPI002FE646C6